MSNPYSGTRASAVDRCVEGDLSSPRFARRSHPEGALHCGASVEGNLYEEKAEYNGYCGMTDYLES